MKKKIFLFDLDNTLCTTKKNYYKNSKPIKKMIDRVNLLKNKGHIIKIFTSRYMGRNNENYKFVKKKYYKETIEFLNKWEIEFDELILGKPSYDFFIDFKFFNFKEKKTLKIIDKFINTK